MPDKKQKTERGNSDSTKHVDVSIVINSMMAQQRTFSDQDLLDTLFFGKAPSTHARTESSEYKLASKNDAGSLFQYDVFKLASFLDEALDDSLSKYLGIMNSKKSYFVVVGCLAESLYVCTYPGLTLLHYDLYTYLRIDLDKGGQWLKKTSHSVEGILERLGRPYETSENLKSYLALNDGCTAHEPKKLCYEPLIWVMYQDGKPCWLYVAFYLTC
jgi:hypothetical protein